MKIYVLKVREPDAPLSEERRFTYHDEAPARGAQARATDAGFIAVVETVTRWREVAGARA